MDGRGFDNLTRAVASGVSRRGLLKGLLGLGGGAAVAAIARDDAGAADTRWSLEYCVPNGAGGYDLRLVPRTAAAWYRGQGAVRPVDGVCPVGAGCQANLTDCSTDGACCSGICDGGWCRPCRAINGRCGSNAQCCTGACNGLTGTCAVCFDPGFPCSSGSVCCSGICSGNACQVGS